jgi:hypothetical protein
LSERDTKELVCTVEFTGERETLLIIGYSGTDFEICPQLKTCGPNA